MNHYAKKLFPAIVMIALFALSACFGQTETVEVTRVVTETITEEVEVPVEVEVTRVVEVEAPRPTVTPAPYPGDGADEAQAALLPSAPTPDIEAIVAEAVEKAMAEVDPQVISETVQVEVTEYVTTTLPAVSGLLTDDADFMTCNDKLDTYRPQIDEDGNYLFVVHEIEKQSQQTQHNDFWTLFNSDPVVTASLSTSVLETTITEQESSDYAYGLGSTFVYNENSDECPQNFDPAVDAVVYAIARLDQGHSGVVIDNRSGKAIVIANLLGLGEQAISNQWDIYSNEELEIPEEAIGSPWPQWAVDLIEELPAPERVSAPSVTAGAAICQAQRVGNAEELSSIAGPAVVESWETGENRLVLVQAGETASNHGLQGAVWIYCSTEAAQADAESKGLPVYIWGQD